MSWKHPQTCIVLLEYCISLSWTKLSHSRKNQLVCKTKYTTLQWKEKVIKLNWLMCCHHLHLSHISSCLLVILEEVLAPGNLRSWEPNSHVTRTTSSPLSLGLTQVLCIKFFFFHFVLVERLIPNPNPHFVFSPTCVSS